MLLKKVNILVCFSFLILFHAFPKEIAAKTILDVEYFPPKEIFSPVEKIPFPKHPQEVSTLIYFEFGRIKSGRYKDGKLVIAIQKDLVEGKPHFNDPYTPGNYGQPLFRFYRFILFKDKAIALVKTYNQGWILTKYTKRYQIIPFQKQEIVIQEDSDVTIPILEPLKPYEILKTPKPRLTFRFYKEIPNPSEKLTKVVAKHPLLGKIYEAPNKRGYRIVRPDNSVLVLGYAPPIHKEKIKWKDKMPDGNYLDSRSLSRTMSGNSEGFDPYSAPNFVKLNPKELKEIGISKGKFKDSIYTVKSSEHPFIKKFYEKYAECVKDVNKSPKDLQNYQASFTKTEKFEKALSLQEFYDEVPVFFWKDPFKRWIQFSKTELFPLHIAEPLIYLYPEKEKYIQIKIKSPITISSSWPHYESSWEVIAKPNGQITWIKNGQQYPYLFWEGSSLIFPRLKKGFVVKKENISSFLKEKLFLLGLHEREIEDFLNFWQPRLQDHPYYLISFFPEEWIHFLAPLEVHPKPDTIIRVLMDYQPLSKPKSIPQQEFPPPKSRKGFTLVEWGGILR